MEKQYYEKAAKWRAFLQSYFQNKVDERKEFVKQQADFILAKKAELHFTTDFSARDKNKQAIFTHLKTVFPEKPTTGSLEETHFEVLDNGAILLNDLPDIMVEQQKKERFKLLENDGFFLRFLKFFKIIAFFISRIPFHFLNLFRKNKRPLRYWNHEVRLKKLIDKHLAIDFINCLSNLEDSLQKEFLAALETVKDYEKNYNIDEAEANVLAFDQFFAENFRHSIKNAIDEWYEKSLASITEEYELDGTVELKKRHLSEGRLSKEKSKALKKWQRIHHQWNNTAYALFEDWRSELELSALQAFIQAGTSDLSTNIEDWQKKIRHNYLQEIDQFLLEAQSNFEFDREEEASELRKKITQVNYQTKKQLDQGLLQKLQDTLSKNSLLNQLDRLEHQINERIDQLANQYVVTKNNQFNIPLADSDLSYISNYELLSFEIEPKLNEKLEDLKSKVFQKMGELLILVGDIDEMVSYMLSTASNALDEEQKELEALKIISEGFQRAHNKSEESKDRLSEIILLCVENLRKISQSLIDELQKLKENENVSALKIRINKAKAFQKSEAFTVKVADEAIRVFNISKAYTLQAYQRANDIRMQLNKRFLSSTIVNEPNRDVSDFLNESNTIIDKLPVIYKRLYAIEPLNDIVLFEGRELEINRLATAFQAWEKGKYASVLLTGEKWSGLTSLINYGIKQLKLPYTPVRMALAGNNPEPDAICNKLSQLIGLEETSDPEEIIKYLNEGNKRVIILEDLQKVFLRVLYGQRALSVLVEIITATQKNIFWIASMSVYTFNYLERSLKMSAFFSYHIPLSPISSESISQLIIKRNRISGFKIEFEASEKDLNDKKFNRLDEKEKQLYLKERFFKELNAFAKSNISMALMYWLLSTKEVSGQSIVIKNFKKPDLSFLSSLQSDRIFVLLALIMHDGLTERQIASVLSIDLQKIKFLVLEMTEDGILTYQNNIYMVNTLVYRNAVQLLKARNMIVGKS
ncbi:hypothetical protein GCM10011506_32430 [Marivirga lumbricoides]|uniref:ATP-binding protein n=1 Tax=Marivirga lumbricoides TaxID=1046115 RepID=A0ABQ1MSS4_9BACT|nr:hypothetical protein GCM10011506_32430 [Marivirga lumbricoides]